MILNDDIDVLLWRSLCTGIMIITLLLLLNHYEFYYDYSSIASSRPGDNPEKTSESDDDGRLQNDQLWIRHFHVPRSK